MLIAKEKSNFSFKFKKNKNKFDRITFLTTVIFILSGFIVLRLFNLQILKYDSFKVQATGFHKFYREISPKRGEIFVQNKNSKIRNSFIFGKGVENKNNLLNSLNLYPAAVNIELNLLYANPSLIENPETAADRLSPILEVPKEELLYRLSKKNDLYEPLKHYINDEKVKMIKDLKIKGLGFESEIRRFYPDGNLFSHIVGFLGFKDRERYGQYGLEEYYQDILAGEKGIFEAEKDAFGRWLPISDRLVKKVRDGADLILTIDYNIQFVACRELENAVQEYEAEGGTIIITEPKTGKILALCNRPTFDLNDYSKVDNISIFINPAISYAYEPGSIFKPFTVAAGLDSNKITPDTTYKDDGYVKVDKFVIKNSDYKAHGIQTMTQVLEKSLNTGVIFIIKKLGSKIFRKYVESFGFGELTGIELIGETSGKIDTLKKRGEIYAATASYGHGISVTPLQMVVAYSAIANQGKLMKPYLVDKIVNSDGSIIQIEPQFIRQSINPSTAVTLSAMLVSVVKNGYAKSADVEGYYVAGKTGTALIPDKEKGGYSDEVIHSFVGFAPVDNPKFVALVKLDKPGKGRFASYTAAKVFGKIAKFMLNYYEIPPDY